MPDEPNPERARKVADAWRSGGAHDLARELVLVARSEGADLQLQEEIAEVMISSEEPPTQVDLDYALRE